MTKFSVPNMSCGHCTASIENKVLDADEGALIEFDLDARTVSIDSTLDPDALKTAIKDAGFEAEKA